MIWTGRPGGGRACGCAGYRCEYRRNSAWWTKLGALGKRTHAANYVVLTKPAYYFPLSMPALGLLAWKRA